MRCQCFYSAVMVNAKLDYYPHDALNIWAENKPVDEYNATRLNQIPAQQYTITAIDQYPQHVSKQDIDRILERSRSETSGLDYQILIKEGCRVMLTTNIDIADRLINGQMGTVIKSQCPQIWTKQRHKSKNRFCSNFAHRLALASKQTDHS